MGAHRPDPLPRGQARIGGEAARNLHLSSDLFLIMLDDQSGKLRVRAAPVVLAGGLLAELLSAGNVTLAGGRLAITDATPPTDPLLMRVLGWLMTEPDQNDPAFWLRYLAGVAVEEIASQLVSTGWIHLVERGLVRVRTKYQPVNANEVFWRPARLFHELNRQPTFDDLILYGFIDAVDFTSVAFRSSGGLSAELHQWIIRQLGESRAEHLVLIHTVRALAAQGAITLRG